MNESGLETPRRYGPSRWLIAGIVVTGLTSMLSLVAMIAHAIAMVGDGRGLETYRTFWLNEDSWIGFLTFVGCGSVAVLIGLVLRFVHFRRERLAWLEHERRWARKS